MTFRDAFVIVDNIGAPVCLSTSPLGDDGEIIGERYVHEERATQAEFAAGLWRTECLEWRKAAALANGSLRLLIDKTVSNRAKGETVSKLAKRLLELTEVMRLTDEVLTQGATAMTDDSEPMLYEYVFSGTATVSVTCRVEAESEEKARAMVESGDCLWQCDDVDGEVTEIEFSCSDEEPSND